MDGDGQMFFSLNQQYLGITIKGISWIFQGLHQQMNTIIYWLVVCNMFFHILGMSSSQLTFIFFRGVQTTNQYIYIYTNKSKNAILKMGWVKIVVPQWLDPMVFLDQQSWWDVFGYELEKHVVCVVVWTYTYIGCWLVVTGTFFIFPIIYGIILPID